MRIAIKEEQQQSKPLSTPKQIAPKRLECMESTFIPLDLLKQYDTLLDVHLLAAPVSKSFKSISKMRIDKYAVKNT
jgi:hypothetical protein